ncbi:MAG: hypothetical protein ACE5D0_00985 [Fidelibacterota bacterium]
MEIQTRHIKCVLLLLFFQISVLIGQNVPINLKHPVNDFILRYHSIGIVKTIHPGLRPFSINQVMTALDEISNAELSKNELELLLYFKKEFDFKNLNNGIKGPWQSNQLKTVLIGSFSAYDQKHKEIRFLSYRDEELTLWADWEELFSIEVQDTIQRLFYNDRVTISGQINNNLSFFSRYSLYRVEHKDSYPIPKEFKQGYLLLEENTDWLIWDVSEASIKWTNSIMNVELSKLPIYWGFSRRHSPIFSENIQPFSFLRLSKNYKRFRTESVMGSLIPNGDQPLVQKHLAAHRFELDLLSTITISFNEMVIYARRNLELGYLLPVNLFWSEEHSLGNHDNVLMSFDALWNVKPGLSVYGTFFWDELSWFKLFSSWWANKFIFQSGLHWVPFPNPKLPDFRIEFSVSRPWVYTHEDSLLTYTSAGHGIGFPVGPNSKLLYIEMNFWPTYKTSLSLNISYLAQGSGMGSDPNDNYGLRDKSLDDSTPWLLGDVKENVIIGSEYYYRVTELFYISGNVAYNTSEKILEGKLGLLMNY